MIPRSISAALLLALAIATPFVRAATNEDDEHPATTKPGVRLQFVPPPMEGTISMGIYDKAGKLVRTLHREADTDEFTVALNGLITVWDGKDNSGAQTAPGTYFARGYMVGEFDSEGFTYECNDWVETDSSPHIRKVRRLIALDEGMRADAEDIAGATITIACDDDGNITTTGTAPEIQPSPSAPLAYVRDGHVFCWDKEERELKEFTAAVDACTGVDGAVWVIDRSAKGPGVEVKAFSKSGKFLRRLAATPGEPQPYQIAAARNRQAVFLLEASGTEQRVRMLRLEGADATASGTTSTWEVVYSKSIVRCDTLEMVKSVLTFPNGKPFAAQDRIKVNLLANPLEQDKPGSAEVTVGIDANGSFLRLVDGLPLAQLSDTPALKWAVLGRDPSNKSLVLYQSDGAVVEGYRIGRIANMMAFDCGDFSLGK